MGRSRVGFREAMCLHLRPVTLDEGIVQRNQQIRQGLGRGGRSLTHRLAKLIALVSGALPQVNLRLSGPQSRLSPKLGRNDLHPVAKSIPKKIRLTRHQHQRTTLPATRAMYPNNSWKDVYRAMCGFPHRGWVARRKIQFLRIPNSIVVGEVFSRAVTVSPAYPLFAASLQSAVRTRIQSKLLLVWNFSQRSGSP